MNTHTFILSLDVLGCLDWTTFMVGSNVGSSGLVGRGLEVASITCRCSVVLKILHHFVCFPFIPEWIGLDMLNMRAQARVMAVTTACSNACQLHTEETVEIFWSRGWKDMFETLLEGPTVVATHYGLSHCLVMFASKTPAANKYPNRLLQLSECLEALLATGWKLGSPHHQG